MVFTSFPVYQDPPNWHQQPNNNHQPGCESTDHHQQQQHHHQHDNQNQPQQLPPLSQQPAAPSLGVSGVGASSIRPGSMADRARQAKVPQPEQQLKCPRCDSTNTKFCYFNNYNLTQPRHFCKTCRRYWTRGGALRNVPVGGGCRRNKRSKSSSSKSPSSAGTSTDQQRQISHGSTTTTTTSSIPSNTTTNFINANDNITLGHHHMTTTSESQQRPQLPFMTSLHQFIDHYGSSGPDLGLSFSGIHQPPSTTRLGGVVGTNMDFHQMGNSTSSGGGGGGGGDNILSSTGGIEQWRLQQMQQFPFLASLEQVTPSGLYPFQGDHHNNNQGAEDLGQVRTRASTGSLVTQLMTSVKMEDNQATGLNLSRQFMGITNNNNNNNQGNNDQYWGNNISGNAWTDLSDFSSSTSHL